MVSESKDDYRGMNDGRCRCPNACDRSWPVLRRGTGHGPEERLPGDVAESRFDERKLLGPGSSFCRRSPVFGRDNRSRLACSAPLDGGLPCWE